MSKNAAIDIFLRVRPSKRAYKGVELKQEENKLSIHIPKDKTQGYVNNQKENYNFLFNHMFDMSAKQEDVFNVVAKDVVDSALEGYNGTIFAYGQTGSGKTFTMTGGAERYVDRGLIPRTLSYIFNETKKKGDTFYKISVSYIEIYNNDGYDLLDENHVTKNLSDLKKVIPRESNDETLILDGLSVHKAESEEQALNLLFIGDTNRVVSETPKNDASTRSHCIFIIQIEGEKADSGGKKTQARIYLVDLSGSERVGVTGVKDLLLTEARYINLSLHYLEHVIICLNKKANGEDVFVPYRNSLMTRVLRDSLGGNCKTRMIATMSAEEADMDESISTCRFAMRVALIKNSLLKNEAVDPALIIQQLKKENEALKAEIAFLKGDNAKTALDSDDQEACKKLVENYITNPDPSAKIVLKDMLMIQECFYYFKHRYNDMAKRQDKLQAGASANKIMHEGLDMKNNGKQSSADNSANQEEIKRLKLLVQQRDNEIAILLSLIGKNKAQGNDESMLVPVTNPNAAANTSVIMADNRDMSQYKVVEFKEYNKAIRENEQTPQKSSSYKDPVSKPLDIVQTRLRGMDDSASKNANMSQAAMMNPEIQNMLITPLNLTNEQLKDRAGCFELFRKSYRKNQAMEDNKEVLKDKFAQAKQLGVVVNTARSDINRIKNQIEDLRKERALQGLVNNDNEVIKHPDEDRLTKEIDRLKKVYKDNYDELKDLKSEIENIQSLLERNHQKLQADFEKWLSVIFKQNSMATGHTSINTTALPSNTLQESQRPNMNSSHISSTSSHSKSRLDPEVEKNLADFYKARDAIYKQ